MKYISDSTDSFFIRRDTNPAPSSFHLTPAVAPHLSALNTHSATSLLVARMVISTARPNTFRP